MFAVVLASVAASGSQPAQAGTGLIYTVVDADNDPYNGIYLRDGAAMAAVRRIPERYMLYGTSVELICGTWGESVGPYANRRWHLVRVASGATVNQEGWIADRYLNTPNRANEATPGEPECGTPPPPTTTPPPPPPAGASKNTPVWIGAGYPGSYKSSTRPGTHGGNQVAFDFYSRSGTTVKFYAAPKNSAYNGQITAHIISSAPGSGNAVKCGYYAVVEVRHSGIPIGRITFSHLATRAPIQAISRWGGTVGTIASLPFNQPAGSCYQVTNSGGEHSHIEFRSYGNRLACAQDWGAIPIPEGRYQGYIGDYGKAPLSGNRCPAGI